jgi:cell division protein FtsI/penicillin-binding protein 2
VHGKAHKIVFNTAHCASILPQAQKHIEFSITQGEAMPGQDSRILTRAFPTHLLSQLLPSVPEPEPEELQPCPEIDVNKNHLRIVGRAMARVTNSPIGTAYRARIKNPEFRLAGKTGTAQVPNRDDDAWFVAFAPYENPAIAVAAVIEGGGGGGAVAGPIVRQVIEAYFKQSGTADQAATDTLLTAH